MLALNDFDFSNKKALIRVDFNVPFDKLKGLITDDKRIKAAIPTISHVLKGGGAVILLSHFGRPKFGFDKDCSLRLLRSCLSDLLGKTIYFAEDCIGDDAQTLAKELQPGEVLLLENVRFHKEETSGDISFARKLAHLGDCFINDAFGAAHRAHASTTQIATFFPNAKMMGFLMQGEIETAQKVIKHGNKPFTAIIGGAKVSDKLLIIKNLLSVADHIIIGGGMAYTFFKAMGGEIGSSLCEEELLETCSSILLQAKSEGVSIHLPADSVIADAFSASAQVSNCSSDKIPKDWMGLDIGEKAIGDFQKVILNSKTLLWNGPMGVFELTSFSTGTKSIAAAVALATRNGAFSLIGGGDSAAAVQKFGFEDQVSYVSTGGGALLEYFEGKELPGISALTN